ncbi:MAG: 2-oxoisovalerate dehydrogenase [Gammaproteobacteria bacterium]|nr:2-oxoisovalerate dehydrogenase [Gammaproteobacteria bacterium]
MSASEIIFEVAESVEGGYEARALGHSIFTRGDDWDNLRDMAREAVLCHFVGDETPQVIRLHLVRDEAVAA